MKTFYSIVGVISVFLAGVLIFLEFAWVLSKESGNIWGAWFSGFFLFIQFIFSIVGFFNQKIAGKFLVVFSSIGLFFMVLLGGYGVMAAQAFMILAGVLLLRSSKRGAKSLTLAEDQI